jgi:GTP-binding protein
MKISAADFVASFPSLDACPASSLPEFAFIGRSNVGKSSLINLLVGRRDLAKVSGTPGKTRMINFFLVNRTWHLVDLPGYGFAQGPQIERYRFNVAVADYLEHRSQLATVFVLIDSRLRPQKIDLEFLTWLTTDTSVPYAIVFTKTDKLSASANAANHAAFLEAIAALQRAPTATFATSIKTRVGRTEVLAHIHAMADRRPRLPLV